MKSKTIKSLIAKKMVEWWKTIEDSSLRERVEKNTIVTGGCIASMLLKERVNDFDVYFRTRDVALDVAKYYVQRFSIQKQNGIECGISVIEDGERIKIKVQSSGIASEKGTDKAYEYFESSPDGESGEYVGQIMQDPGAVQDVHDDTEKKAIESTLEDKTYRAVFMSTNAITLSGGVQIVLRFFGEPEEIHKNYDFVHCTNYWSSWDNKLTLHQAALESLLAKELRYVGSRYPICSIFRLRKFVSRGWSVNAGQILKMCLQVSELNLKDVNVLEDQLIGVDVAYFVDLVARLKANDPEKVNAAYLVEIIDRMF